MVFGSIQKIAFTAIVGLVAASFFKDAFAKGLGPTLGEVGTGANAIGGALSSIGSGSLSFLEGIGTGASKLLNPLFTLKELAGPIAGTASGGTSIEAGENFAESGAQEVAVATAAQVESQTFTLAGANNSSLQLTSAFNALGNQLTGIRGNPLAERALSRTEETFGGILSTSAGGDRAIRGSAALFERLGGNIQ